MYFINYFYVTVTDAAPKCLRAESPASSWSCAELSQRRVGRAELSHFGHGALHHLCTSVCQRRTCTCVTDMLNVNAAVCILIRVVM